MSNGDGQPLSGFTRADVARIFDVPEWMLGALPDCTWPPALEVRLVWLWPIGTMAVVRGPARYDPPPEHVTVGGLWTVRL